MKLYKFRSLDTKEKKDHVFDILYTGMFYLANWSTLNDPMEGYFYYVDEDNSANNIVNKLVSDKQALRVCSFASSYNPMLLWTYYSDNHKGIVIEIEIKNNLKLKKVKYKKIIPIFENLKRLSAQDLLITKIDIWEYENEYRYIDTLEKCKIGEIKSVYFGIRTNETLKMEIINKFNGRFKFHETKLIFANNSIVKK